MYVIIDDTIAVTVTDTSRVTTHVIAIAAPLDDELESTRTYVFYFICVHARLCLITVGYDIVNWKRFENYL